MKEQFTPNKSKIIKRIQISTMRAIFSHFQLYFPQSLQRLLEVILLPHHRIVLQIQHPQRLLQTTLEEGPARSQGIRTDLELHHPYVLYLGLEIALLCAQLRGSALVALEFASDCRELSYLTVYFALLGSQLPFNNPLVDPWEVVDCQMVFHHQQAHDEIVPRMVLLVVFLDQRTQSPLDKEILQQLVVGLAVVLVTDPLIHSRLMRSLLSLRKISPLGLSLPTFFPSPSAALGYLLIFFVGFVQVLILLQSPKGLSVSLRRRSPAGLGLRGEPQRLGLLCLVHQSRYRKILRDRRNIPALVHHEGVSGKAAGKRIVLLGERAELLKEGGLGGVSWS